MKKINVAFLVLMLLIGGSFNRLLAIPFPFSSDLTKDNSGLIHQSKPLKIGKKDLPKLLKLLTKLGKKAKDPLFKMHFKSLKTMIEDTTYSVAWEAKDSLWVSNALKFFRKEGSNWLIYSNGSKPLIMSFISPTDGKNSYYQLYLPKPFDLTKKDYPFYMELHGSGGGKNDNPRRMLLQPYQLEKPGITLQGYRGEGLYIKPWGRGDKSYKDQAELDIYECLEHFDNLFQTDEKRQYLYGFSMGSMGAFHIAQKNMDRWTAIGFYSGPGRDLSPEKTNLFKGKPVWVAWGEEERRAEKIKEMKDSLIEAGAKVEWYEIKDVGHKYLSEYQVKLMDWLKEKKK